MTWALDKQQAAQKVHTNYGERVTSPAPHPLPTAHSYSLMPAFSRTLVKIVGQKTFWRCGCNARDLRDHKMFYQIGNRPHTARGVVQHF